MLSIGVFRALDGAAHATGTSKARGVAASLAQQDQERLRAMTITNLASVTATPRDATVCANGTSGCVKYHIASSSAWVADTTAQSACTVSGARSYNLLATSTVTWDGQGSAPAITQKSLVSAPPGTTGGGQGSLGVRIRQDDGTAVPGISVTLSGPTPKTGTTD